MGQQPSTTPDFGATHAWIVRLRREPGSDTWRIQVLDVHSGATIAFSSAPDQDGSIIALMTTALAAAIERLIESSSTQENPYEPSHPVYPHR